jgi:hypothetical protein
VAFGLLAGALCVPALAGAVRAAQVDPDGGGYGSGDGYVAEVQVTFSGEAAPGGGSTKSVRIAPTCWWEPASADYQNAAASLAWYDMVTGGLQTREVIGQYGPRRIWEEAAEAEANGSDTSWYRAVCRDAADLERYDPGSAEEVDPVAGNPENFVTYYYRAFAAGAAIPPPLVSSEQLALAAREEMVIPPPVTQRNPKIQSAGAPTLVGLPTWFWVEEEEAVGGADGNRDITAAVGDVSATVTAVTDGLTLSSPGGGKECSTSQALVAYGPGIAEENACTVEFDRASVAFADGYPVEASTLWGATWEGSDGESGVLTDLTQEVTENVPVAEVQNIVTRP